MNNLKLGQKGHIACYREVVRVFKEGTRGGKGWGRCREGGERGDVRLLFGEGCLATHVTPGLVTSP